MPEHPNPWRSQPPTSISSLLPSFARSTEEGRYANSTCFAVLLCSAPHGSEYKGRRQRPVRPQPAGGGSGCLSPAEEGERLGGIWRRTARGFGLICSACGVFVSFRLVSLSIGRGRRQGRASKHMWDFLRGHRRRDWSGRARPITSRGGRWR